MKPRHLVKRGPAARDRAGRCVYGVHAIAARLALQPPQIHRLYVREDAAARVTELAAEAGRRGVPVQRVQAAVLRDLSGTDHHHGAVADVPPFRYHELSEQLMHAPNRVLVLDQLNDPQNFGALLRTTEAAGIGMVVIPRDGAVGVTASVEAAAAGAAVRVAVVQVVNLARALHQLKEHDYWIVGLAPRVARDLYEFDPPARLAIVLGGEAGLRRLVREACDVLLSIPMQGKTESLNASVAGALVMYAFSRQPQRGS